MIDKPLFIAIIALFTISLIMTYSLSTYAVLLHDGFTSSHFLIRQIVSVLMSIMMIVFLSKLDPDIWFVRIGFMVFILSFAAIITMPFMSESLVNNTLGAKRWIRLGPVSISPVEYFKLGFVFFLSWSFPRKMLYHGKLSLWNEFKVVSPYMGIFLLAVIFIAVLQKDLGQVIVLAIVLLILFLFVGRSLKLFFLNISIGIVGVIILIKIFGHRRNRIADWWPMVQDTFLWFFPESIASTLRVDAATEPYQMLNAFHAINNGGFWGVGLSNGQFKLGYLSDIHTDFILAGIGEELGFIGIAIVTLLICIVVFRVFQIASKVENSAYHFFGIGVGLIIILPFLVNSYGISGMLPVKGIAVPFLSYGGSHIMASSIGIGLVLMISKRRNSNARSAI